MTTYSRVGALSASFVVTAVLSMTLAFTPTALAEDSSSSVVDSPTAVAQSDVSSSAVARSDDSSSAVQATEAPAPVAAQSVEEDGWHSDAGGTYYVRGGSRVVSAWLVLEVAPSGEKVGWQRYWVGVDGYLARGRLVTEAESGWWAYAEADGTITSMVSRVGVDPISHPDTAILAMLLAA